MRPREQRETGEQDLFRSRLDQIIDTEHALVKLARTINWRFLEEKFDAVYKDGPGQPPLPTRLMAGLAILKHTYNLSDEVVCELWLENPSVLPVLLRGGVFPAPVAARSLLDDQLAQSHGRRTAAGAVAGEPVSRNQDWRDEAR